MSSENYPDHDRTKELRGFDETKLGVKGLADSGILTIPRIFVRPPEELAKELNSCAERIKVPGIDLIYIQNCDKRKEFVEEIGVASDEWGFFQVINHGIPLTVLNEMIDGIKKFHELDANLKEFYTRESMKKVKLNSNFDLYKSKSANWRDTLAINNLSSDHLDPGELPAACSESTVQCFKVYQKTVQHFACITVRGSWPPSRPFRLNGMCQGVLPYLSLLSGLP